MADLRTGAYGQYYGSPWGSSEVLTKAQMQVNALYIYSSLSDKGWTDEAIAGVLGNMEHESAINPGRWQGENIGSGPAYGLVQWDPWTKYVNWCTDQGLSDPSEMDNAIARIIYELENGEQYYKNVYPYTFKEFVKSTDSPYTLACAFAFDYERSWVTLYGTEAEKEALRQERGGSAEDWYTYITGNDPTPPDPDYPGGGGSGGSAIKRKGTGYKFVLFGKRRRIIT